MNFEGAKENIQPLAAGRNVEQLEVALNAESQHECQEELLEQRRQFELAIANYSGEDPLELWFEYIGWVEQSYPKSGKESALDDLLKKCLSKFEKDLRYAQDPRLVRLFIKYIDSKKNPNLYYTKLYNGGVGTMVADLYIAWAHYFDVLDDFEQAKAVYQKGLDARAAPIDHLKQIYERFQFSVGQRVVRKEEYRQEFLTSMEAQRNAFTSLHSLKRSKVGSIRTGSAVKSHKPGHVRQNQSLSSSSSSNAPLKVYDGASQETLKPPTQPYRSVVEEIENSMVENNIEPGPWSKPSSKKGVFHNVHGNSTLKFAILEDDIEQPPIKFGRLPPDDGNLGINLPKNFVRKNDPQTPFVLSAYVEDVVDLHTMPAYQKFYLHPSANVCFQPEELRHYQRLKERNISNDFTKSRDKYWGMGSKVGVRILPNFPRHNQPQTDMETERPDISLIPSTQRFECNLSALYPKDSKFELQFEENQASRPQKNQNNAGEMDETVCVRGRQSFGVNHTRKSIVGGGRKSIMPVANDREFSIRKLPPVTDGSGSDMDLTDDFDEKVSANALIDKVEEFLKPAALPKPETSALPNTDSEFKKPVEQPKTTQWSVFTDDDTTNSKSPTFAVPLVPLARATESVPVKSPYPISPQTGAVRKSILRKSTISEHAIEGSTNHVGASDNAPKSLPQDLDYSLCTQAFNVNLAEQMASTPVSIRRTEPLTEQIRSQDIQPALNPLKLSTIMETTEGSASAASTKSSTQFSSPEDNELSKRSNVTNRTKLVGTSVYPEDEATGSRENYSTSEPMQGFSVDANKVAGRANYSSNVERTLPAIQLSLLPDATVTTAATNVGPTKSYPFPIFEDTQTATTIASMSSEPKGPEVRNSSDPRYGQFNETSVWIKDEPKSFTLMNSSTAEESFVLPLPIVSLAPKLETTYNNFEGFASHSKAGTQMDSSAAEESFVLPLPTVSLAPKLETTYNNFEGFASYSKAGTQMDSSAAEESFVLPLPTVSLAPKLETTYNNFEGFASHSIAGTQVDSSAAEESFVLPLPTVSLAPKLETTYNNFEGFASHSKAGTQMNSSTAEESFVLPLPTVSLAPKLETTYNNFEGFASHSKAGTQMDSSAAEESFVLPLPTVSLAPQLETTYNNFEGFASQTEASAQMGSSTAEESFALPFEKQRKSLAPPAAYKTDDGFKGFETTQNQVDLQNDSSTSQQMSVLSTTFDVDDSDDSEEEIIEVPDETLIEDAPKIVHVQSLANRNDIDTSTRISISFTDEEVAAHMNKNANDQSIYFKNNSISVAPAWIEKEVKLESADRTAYRHEEVNLEESRMVIDTKLAEELVDPFNEVLRGAILEHVEFMDSVMEDALCDLIATVPTVTVKRTISFKDTHFDVLKCIGHGAYGRVYSVKSSKDGCTYAVKKEMPANLWEYYILKQVHSRVVENLYGYMKIDMAVIANDGSLLFSQYSQYGTLLDVCNRVFTSLNNNINESIVFILAHQMLDLVDGLHRAGILHLDLKPDNFLVIGPMSTNHRELFIQLIDFGNAVDLQQYPPGQQFNAALETKHFVCLEMLERRPWIFEPDLYCLAATVHSVLFGRYLEVRKTRDDNYRACVKIPRYFNRIWSTFFDVLINIPGGATPNLQDLKQSFEDVIVSDNNIEQKVGKFNEFVNGK